MQVADELIPRSTAVSRDSTRARFASSATSCVACQVRAGAQSRRNSVADPTLFPRALRPEPRRRFSPPTRAAPANAETKGRHVVLRLTFPARDRRIAARLEAREALSAGRTGAAGPDTQTGVPAWRERIVHGRARGDQDAVRRAGGSGIADWPRRGVRCGRSCALAAGSMMKSCKRESTCGGRTCFPAMPYDISTPWNRLLTSSLFGRGGGSGASLGPTVSPLRAFAPAPASP